MAGFAISITLNRGLRVAAAVCKLRSNVHHAFRTITCTPKTKMSVRGTLGVRPRYLGISSFHLRDVDVFDQDRDQRTWEGGTVEVLGEVENVNAELDKDWDFGQAVIFTTTEAPRQIMRIPEDAICFVPDVNPAYIPFLSGGLTAVLALTKVSAKSGDTVLIKDAAESPGPMIVQVASRLFNTDVIATCQTSEETAWLKKLGCKRVINLATEDLGETLRTEYSHGIDIIVDTGAAHGVVITRCRDVKISRTFGDVIEEPNKSSAVDTECFKLGCIGREAHQKYVSKMVAMCNDGLLTSCTTCPSYAALPEGLESLYIFDGVGKCVIGVPEQEHLKRPAVNI